MGSSGVSDGRQTDVIDFFTRPGCHLCDVAMQRLRPVAARHGIAIRVRNIEEREEWQRTYGQQIPVGVFRGRRLFKYTVDEDRLDRALHARLAD